MVEELLSYISPLRHPDYSENEYLPTQIGSKIQYITKENPDIENLDIIILGCGEFRGQNDQLSYSNGPDIVRNELYQLHYWHEDLKIGDLGNVIEGLTLNDTRAALKTILSELNSMGKRVLIIGGAHDLTIQQYEVFKSQEKIIDFTIIDMLADLNEKPGIHHDNYLYDALTTTPNFLRTFNLVGFQSYYINPNIIETFDKLKFDCLRLGKVRENIEFIEPLLRSSEIASIDINCVKYSDAPANKFASPNGFTGDEICKITKFAGMSEKLNSFGIFGYNTLLDSHQLTAKLIAQMIWYFFDGIYLQKEERPFENKEGYSIYHLSINEKETKFYKSKISNRWWMQIEPTKTIPCTYQDYLEASHNEIPERWLREMERSV